MYNLNKRIGRDENNCPCFEYYYEDAKTGKFIRTLTEDDKTDISKQISKNLKENKEKIFDRMSFGSSLGGIL